MLRLGMAIGLPVALHVGYRVKLLRFVLLQLSFGSLSVTLCSSSSVALTENFSFICLSSFRFTLRTQIMHFW